MNPRWRMLLWEQGRTAGVLCLAFCAMSLLHVLVVHVLMVQTFDRASRIRPMDVATFLNYSLYIVPLFFAVTLTVRQGGSGHLVWDFEPRLMRLPLTLKAVFITVVSARTACMCLLLVFNILLALTFPWEISELRWTSLALPLHVFLALQALVWSYRRAPILPLGAVALTFSGTLMYRFTTEFEEGVIETLQFLATHPATSLIIPPAALAMMAVGVFLERRDAHFGPPRIGDMIEQLNNSFSLSVNTARSPFEAQLWYEYRRVGRLLPLFLLSITGLIVLFFVFTDGAAKLFELGLAQYIPLVALPLAAIFSGVIGRSVRSHYAQLRPVPAHNLAAAQCMAQLRALLCAAPLAVILFFLFLLASPVERGILATAWQEGYANVVDVIVYSMRPLAVSLFVAWLMLWVTTGLGAMVAVTLLVILPANIYYYLDARGGLYDYFEGSFYNVLYILIATALATTLFSLYKKKVPVQKVFAQLLCCLMIAVFVRFGSRELDGLAGLLIALTCGVVCVLPLTAMTWVIEKKRHTAKR